MKKIHFTLLTAASLALAACGTDDDATKKHSQSSTTKHEEKSESRDTKPHLGMTRSQVRARYGDPDRVSQSGRGEVWHYWFNKGHAFIPYNYGYHARTADFVFNADGVLTDFNYNE
jgi:outer membrane protein assembly factor BamE (lipoprotein component of BamABCDE complex)